MVAAIIIILIPPGFVVVVNHLLSALWLWMTGYDIRMTQWPVPIGTLDNHSTTPNILHSLQILSRHHCTKRLPRL